MANHASAAKRNRQSEKRRERNRNVRAALRTEIKKARTAIADKQAENNTGILRNAVSALAKAVSKGIFKKKTASRRISRLMKAANKA